MSNRTSLRSLFTQLALLTPAWLLSGASPLATKRAAVPSGVPSYVLDYAPLVYLYSGETYFPSDIGSQLTNTVPEINFVPLTGIPNPLTLDNLDALNSPNGTATYLTSKVDITTNPAWLNGVEPNAAGSTGDAVSCVTVVVDHGSGLVDAFYFYFYAFNYGGTLFDIVVGDHVGDWEHNMIRFNNGTPQQMWFSQHSDGEAYYWDVVQKSGIRPISYSANGSHANYGTTGSHSRIIPDIDLPGAILADYTSAGPLWDPVASSYFVSYSPSTLTFSRFAGDTTTPLGWLSFLGGWGDQQYPDSDPRQDDVLDLHLVYKYESGPTGPEDKDLVRTNICPNSDVVCLVRDELTT